MHLSASRGTQWRTVPAMVAWLAVATVLVASPVNAFSLTEILYVKGCKDSSPPRSTAGCFAGPKLIPSVDLSLRGLNFPQPPPDGQGERLAEFRVELVESLPLSPLEGEDAHSSTPHLRVPCEDAAQSEVFPTQIVTCSVANPLAGALTEAAAGGADQPTHRKALETWQAAGGAVWFDVVVQVLAETEEGGEAYEDLAILRRAVQLDVTGLLRKQGLKVKGADRLGAGGRAGAYNLSTHPLERLYTTPKRKRSEDVMGDSQDDSGVPDPRGEDYLWVELGIGGLKRELRELFRRVFLSRLPSLANLTEALDIQHVRGVILYGPPGNGKSLIARSLFKLLGPDTRLTVVNAADVLSKFVGESEKNLRDAFGGQPIGTSSKAESDRKDGKDVNYFGIDEEDDDDGQGKLGRRPKKLHVLVIDEFESLFRRRGHSTDESSAKAVYDGVTNTLLSLMDGIETRNDLLVVGLTNRLQSIDAAMLRPGRFEVLIEVPSPDVPAREEIFFIHTAKLREEGFLSEDVTLHELAVRSGGFSGSDIAGAVRSATSYALLRYRQAQADAADPETGHDETAEASCPPSAQGEQPSSLCDPRIHPRTEPFQVTMQDLEQAMADIRSAKDETSSLSYLSEKTNELSGAVDFDGSMTYRTDLVVNLVRQVSQSHHTYTGVVGISGAAGTGKSFLAKQLTTVSDFDTVRFLSCRRLVELRDRAEQLEQVRDALGEASRVRSGLVVLDDFDVLLDSLSGNAVLEATLKNMLYEYRTRALGVSRSLQGTKDSAREVSETGGGGITVNAGSALHDQRNRRFLMVTSSRQDALTVTEPDVRLRVRAIHRAGIAELLAHYNVSSLATTARWQLTSSYPPTISFRNFLRVTDRALWFTAAASEDQDKADGGRKLERLSTATSVNPFLALDKTGEAQGGRYLLWSAKQGEAFAEHVRRVTATMTLADSFTGWYTRLPRTDLYAEVPGTAAAEASGEGEEGHDAAALKGVNEADEAAADVGVDTMW